MPWYVILHHPIAIANSANSSPAALPIDQGPLPFLESTHCPHLDRLPSLKAFETCFAASIDPLRLESPNPDTTDYVLEEQGFTRIIKAFANVLRSTSGKACAIRHMRLYIHLNSEQWRSWPPKPVEGLLTHIEGTFTLEYAEQLGLNDVDRVLSAPDGGFNALEKLTIVFLPLRQFKQCDQVRLLALFRSLFQEWELERGGKLDVTFLDGKRLVDNKCAGG
jgi:hypothetical protein